jgi:two-component system response regulator PilR (NtrC family)
MAKILVIDDSESVLTFVKSVLRRESHEVWSMSSGAEALEMLRKARVDLVITDIHMPPPDGLEIMRKVRAMKLNVPFIAISSYQSPSNRFAEARGLGADISLGKPFSSTSLVAAVEAALDKNYGANIWNGDESRTTEQ